LDRLHHESHAEESRHAQFRNRESEPYERSMEHESHNPESLKGQNGSDEGEGIAVKLARTSDRRALLVFAGAVGVDLIRRRWPKSLAGLLRLRPFLTGLAPGIDVHLFTPAGAAEQVHAPIQTHTQEGGSFGERIESAIEALANLGYDEIVIVGRDCPELRAQEIEGAFGQLRSRRLVLGPDHRGGCYLIGFHTPERVLLKGVRWQRNTDCAELLDRFGASATLLFPVKHDLDSTADLRLLSQRGSAWRHWAAKFLALLAPLRTSPQPARADLRLEKMKLRWQLPPPRISPIFLIP
jgi:2-phospho-L-lactate guanylyltransferase (CobY/MobA/RfbA family)